MSDFRTRSATDEHPSSGVGILRERGWPGDILDAVMGHAAYTGVVRETRMAKALFAVDELTGLITATALVKPTKSVHDVAGVHSHKRPVAGER
jgi:predicted hydrolase (HD superfamily)